MYNFLFSGNKEYPVVAQWFEPKCYHCEATKVGQIALHEIQFVVILQLVLFLRTQLTEYQKKLSQTKIKKHHGSFKSIKIH